LSGFGQQVHLWPLSIPDPAVRLISPGRRVFRRVTRCHRPWPGCRAPTNPPSRRARPSRSRIAYPRYAPTVGPAGSYLLIRATTTRRCRRALRRRGIVPRIARRGIESNKRLGRHRHVVERSLAWLLGYRRLQIRYERRADTLLGFLQLACALICLNSLKRWKA
jgi:transposase